jgi:GT2 family glycosyltransferase
MDVSVITVTYNSAEHIGVCLQSVLSQSGVTFEVIAVDNASSDDTLAQLAGLKVRVIASPENLGFGRGNNAGFAASTGRYIYLLNPDARLTAPDDLARFCRVMDANPRWGMAGTLVRSADGKSESPPAHIYPGQRHVHRDFSKLPGQIAWVVGASMVIRRELYEKLGGFDPGFFMYSEETDFCLRLREIGFEIGHISEVAVEHIGGASEDYRDPYDASARKLRGLLRFRRKHYAAEDRVFLAKRDLRRARARMIWNQIWAVGRGPGSRAWRKYRLYRAVWEVSREALADPNTRAV